MTAITANGDDFCTAGKGVDAEHCGCIVRVPISECAELASVLIHKCAQMPLNDTAILELVRSIGLETCCLNRGDVYAYYNAYINQKNDSNGAVLCSALWNSINEDKERTASLCVGDTLVIINVPEYIDKVIRQDSGCTHIAQMIEIISDLTIFIQTYEQYLSRRNMSTLLDQLIALTNPAC
jgi:hypothetical protein